MVLLKYKDLFETDSLLIELKSVHCQNLTIACAEYWLKKVCVADGVWRVSHGINGSIEIQGSF